MRDSDMPDQPGSATTGFFQECPVIPAQFTFNATSKSMQADDAIIPRILHLYLNDVGVSEVGRRLHVRAREVLSQATTSLTVAAELNPPFLRPLTTFGAENKTDALVTSEAWKEIKRKAVESHMLKRIYDAQLGVGDDARYNLRLEQKILGHVVATADALVGCPMGMTDGAAALLSKHLGKGDEGGQTNFGMVVAETFRRLTSNVPGEAWTSGQWMTERSGGSDISATQTLARYLGGDAGGFDATGLPLGPWAIDGFKWFSSATDCEVTILLARTKKGLSTFLCPTRRKAPGQGTATEPNGIRIVRLKSKLGTKALPTAELEIKGARGWLVGEEGKGVKEISTILNATRLGTAISSCSYWSRSLAVSRAFSRIRRARGRLLQDHPLHIRWMADETVKYSAAVHLTFFGVALEGASQQGWDSSVKHTGAERLIPKDATEMRTLLRMLTPVIKSKTTVNAVHGVRECLESLGGVGYCENNEDGGLFNIARLYRDVNVNPVWEGTANIMGEDISRVLLVDGEAALADDGVLARWIRSTLQSCRQKFAHECAAVEVEWLALTRLTKTCDREQLLYRSRQILSLMERVVCSCLLMFDAIADDDQRATAIAKRWIASYAPKVSNVEGDIGSLTTVDQLIFLGYPHDVEAHL